MTDDSRFAAADKVFPERRKKQSRDSYDVRRAREKYNRGNELPRTMLGAGIKARLYLTTWPCARAHTSTLKESSRAHTLKRPRAQYYYLVIHSAHS